MTDELQDAVEEDCCMNGQLAAPVLNGASDWSGISHSQEAVISMPPKMKKENKSLFTG
jgi:hypothetical protein